MQYKKNYYYYYNLFKSNSTKPQAGKLG